MTLFIDLRATPSGGIVAREVSLWEDGVKPVSVGEFAGRIAGLDVLFATHGFNVSRRAGVECLSWWSKLLQLPPTTVFIGVLWPGDSKYLPVLDYPVEGEEAMKSGRLLADFLNRTAGGAASLSLVSHSLGARMVLETVNHLDAPVRKLILMAGAIEDDCLIKEYEAAADKAQQIFVLASKMDRVLQLAFPIGNPIGGIVMHGHPYFRTALGRGGPARPIPLSQRGGVWAIPDGWKYGHGDYYPDAAIAQTMPPPLQCPATSAPKPANPEYEGWESSWSAGVVSTLLAQ